jgi:hypothetical protein
LFFILLGLVYLGRIQRVEDFTKMYREYGNLFIYVGSGFLIYSGLVTWSRIFKRKAQQ